MFCKPRQKTDGMAGGLQTRFPEEFWKLLSYHQNLRRKSFEKTSQSTACNSKPPYRRRVLEGIKTKGPDRSCVLLGFFELGIGFNRKLSILFASKILSSTCFRRFRKSDSFRLSHRSDWLIQLWSKHRGFWLVDYHQILEVVFPCTRQRASSLYQQEIFVL